MERANVTVFYLEMRARPLHLQLAARDDATVMQLQKPTVRYYRFLYKAVGEDYHWLSRRKLTDEQLMAVIERPENEIHVLHVNGNPAGFAELVHHRNTDIELVQFGLTSEFMGQGLGKWFLSWTIDKVWSNKPERFWLHTCSLDHKRALPLYKSAGFVQYKKEEILRGF